MPKIFLIVFLLILPVQQYLFSETVVTVLEGEVSAIDYPEWLLKEIEKEELRTGIFIRLGNGDIALVDIYTEDVSAYIPDEVKKSVGDKLVPDVLILLRKNVRRIQGTNWDIVAVESRVKAGYMFRENMVRELSLEEVVSTLNIWEGMQDVYEKIQETVVETKEPEKTEITRTYARDLSFIERTVTGEEEEEEFSEITFAPAEEVTTITTEALSITTSSTLTGGAEGSPYSQTLSASGGISPYTWSLVSGSLPSGLSLSSGGVISGTPGDTTASTTAYSFTIRVTDSAGSTADKTFSLKISGYATGSWTQANTSGFGDSTNLFIRSMAVFGGYIYAGTGKGSAGAEIWRSSDGTTWTQVNTDGFGDASNTNIETLTTFGSYIYAGTRKAAAGAEIWRSSDGSSWTQVNTDGFGDAGNTEIQSMAAFGSNIYAGTLNVDGGEVWRSSDGTTWTMVNTNGFGDTNNDFLQSMTTFGDYIYVGTGKVAAGAEIWRSSDGTTWTQVNTDGFGDADNVAMESMTTFGGYIYIGTGKTAAGAEIWRSSDGTTWTQVNTDGFGDTNNTIVQTMTTFSSNIYAGTRNYTTGGEVWRSSNGTSWIQHNTDGFGSSANRDIFSSTTFGNYIYMGTDNPTAYGQVWRYYEEYLDPLITGKVYDGETGEALGGVITSIYRKDSTTALFTTSANPYSFNVDDGYYYLRAEKEGHTFPSSVISGKTSGDHGEEFAASGTKMTIDIPMDKGYPLEITKTANKKRVINGEIITYQIKIKNNSYYAISNINIIDEITNGFKYISESAYLGASQLTVNSVQFTGRKATFELSSLEGHKNTYLTYQVRVGTGISPGRYKAKAVAWDRVRDWQVSNESSYTVEVIEDPLFTKGTIVGKVFYDLNGNGVQDTYEIPNSKFQIPNKSQTQNPKSQTEPGIAGVKIYTEYGVCVETDKDGKYHIADVPAGNHLLKVDPASLTNCELRIANCEFTTENPYLVKITEGLLAKVNFGVSMLTSERVNELAGEKELADPQTGKPVNPQTHKPTNPQTRKPVNPQTRKPADQFFIVALGEGEVRKVETSGNIEMVEKDDRFDDGIHVDGKLALYLKGKIKGKYLVTLSIDTNRQTGKPANRQTLFTNLDPDKYYPVYGDASQVDYSGVDTQDILYILIEWDESFAKWGNFHTKIPLYERTMSGGIVEYKSISKTKFDDTKTEIKVFGAFTRQMPGHDEFIGTGGSLYYLRHRDITEGSEKIRVEVRDRITNRTIGVITLREEIDYEIDYDTGRLLLKRPLNSITQQYTGSIIANDILAGSSVYLVADYEYLSTEGLNSQAKGVKGSQWIGNHIRVGGTYIEEQRLSDPYKLMGGDATIKINPKIRVDGSYHRTEETLLDNGLSYDGGITFTEQGSDHSDTKSGNAVNINTTAEVFKNTDIYLEYSRQDPYYSISGSIANQGSQKYVGDIIHRLTKNITLGLSHVTQRYFEGSIVGATRSDTTSGLIDYKRGRWDIRTEYQHREVEDPTEASYDTYYGTLPLLRNDFIGARIGYDLFSWLHPYIRGQVTINGPSNDQGTVGSAIKLWEKGELDLSYSKGTIGDSALIGLTTRYGEDTDIYTNIETGNNLKLGKYIKTSYGQTTTTKEGEKIYMVQDYSTYREKFVRGNILGYDKKINGILTIGLTYERSNINTKRLDVDRDSGSVSLSYLNEDFLKGASKLELRQDSSTSLTTRQWLTQNDILLRPTKALSLSGRANWGWTEDRDSDSDLAEFYEVGTGFSYRPLLWDRLNILGKYSYIMDLSPEDQDDFIQTSKALRNVYAVEGIYDLFTYLSLVGKFVYREMSEKVGPRDWVDSDTYLYIGRLNFHITKKWDIAAEYRVLSNEQIEDTKSGWLLEIDRDITDYIRLGVGYNFTDYDDDLRDEDNWDSKGWFVKVTGKY